MARYCLIAVTLCSSALFAGGCSGTGSVPASTAIRAESRMAERSITFSQFWDMPWYPRGAPYAIASGPGNAIWVADDVDQDSGASEVLRIDLKGRATAMYGYGNEASPAFVDMVEGSDGNLWLADSADNQIVRMTPQGDFTTYALPLGDYPSAITSGPDKALWFVADSYSGSAVGRITTGGSMRLFTAGLPAKAVLNDIVSGPDGALSFTQAYNAAIGRITTGGVVTEYSAGISPHSDPYAITSGPGGALWFTELNGARIGKITTGGVVTEYAKGISAGEHPIDLAAGPDDALWFVEDQDRLHGAKVGRITASGVITEYTAMKPDANPLAITKGPDNNMWFVEAELNHVGRINL